jgi:hypothetical protein
LDFRVIRFLQGVWWGGAPDQSDTTRTGQDLRR